MEVSTHILNRLEDVENDLEEHEAKWSEFLATDPEARVRFPEKKRKQ
jgi:hypothetical protein